MGSGTMRSAILLPLAVTGGTFQIPCCAPYGKDAHRIEGSWTAPIAWQHDPDNVTALTGTDDDSRYIQISAAARHCVP
jgi:hypothetical protein